MLDETLLKQRGQEHLLDYTKLMSSREREVLEKELSNIDLEEIQELYKEVYLKRDQFELPDEIEEVNFDVKDMLSKNERNYYEEKGIEAIKNNKFAVVLMAGGQGTRLGHKGPKGTFSFNNKSLFERQAKQIKSIYETTNTKIDWYIMTSSINHEETLSFFRDNKYFGLDQSQVHFFEQEEITALSQEGKLLLDTKKHIMRTPNGNGGVFKSLEKHGFLNEMKDNNVEYIFLNNVDNALVKVLDPMFAGYTVEHGADITTKSIKARPNEKVGRIVSANGKQQILEYSELSNEQAKRLENANIGIHVFKLDFVINEVNNSLPYHVAIKKLKLLDEDFSIIERESLKFELFYFDIFKYASTFATLQVNRNQEFSPLKNKEGSDSIETAKQDLERNELL